MIFTSLHFAAFFAILAILLSLFKKGDSRETLLVGASYYFYSVWDYRFLVLLISYTLLGWILGITLENETSKLRRKCLLAFGISMSVGGLFFFKYAELFYRTWIQLTDQPEQKALGIVLPVAISFTTFEFISYLVDVYRGDVRAARSLRKFSLFMAFFPRLVAGPIIRPAAFLPQIADPLSFDAKKIRKGSQLFLGGMILKLVGADNLANFVDTVYQDPGLYSAGTLVFAAVCYSAQIFCDFHGYTLMAIGLALALGISLPENFRMPYIASSLTDFWRRWHISLSSWLRDYLYIPMGGSRRGRVRNYFNLFLTMAIGGLWHGASWNFLIWGMLHGFFLLIEKLYSDYRAMPSQAAVPRPVRAFFCTVCTFWIVTLLWIPFRSPDWHTTMSFLKGLVSPGEGIVWIQTQCVVVMALFISWHLAYIFAKCTLQRILPDENPAFKNYAWSLTGVLVILIFGAQNTSPFIYFQF